MKNIDTLNVDKGQLFQPFRSHCPAFFAQQRWDDYAPRLGYLRERLPCPSRDATPFGQLLDHGFIARRETDGRHVLFGDPYDVTWADVAPFEELYGLRIFIYHGLWFPRRTTLLEFTVVDPQRAARLFETRRFAGPLLVGQPAKFLGLPLSSL